MEKAMVKTSGVAKGATAKGSRGATAKKRQASPRPAIPRRRLNSPELLKVLLTVEEAAHKLSIGRTACYGLMKRGELRYILIGSTRRIPVDAIGEFVSQASRVRASLSV
jgi:excisionase family DNA binding protein